MQLHLTHPSAFARQQVLKRSCRFSTAPVRPVGPVRSWSSSVETESESYASSDEEESISGNSFFNPQFAAVLQQALGRQGEDALYSGSTPQEPRKKAEVEMLEISVNHCVDRLKMLERMKYAVESSMQLEIKQLERLRFCLAKVEASSAYLSTIQKILDEKEQAENDRYYEQLRSRVCDQVWQEDSETPQPALNGSKSKSSSNGYQNGTNGSNGKSNGKTNGTSVNWWEQNTEVGNWWETPAATAEPAPGVDASLNTWAGATAIGTGDDPVSSSGDAWGGHGGWGEHTGVSSWQSDHQTSNDTSVNGSDSFFGSNFSNEFYGGR